MIKKIHYVWFGGKPLPENVQSCIQSWKKRMPDWEIVRWDESSFDTQKYRWVREALQVKRYAFAADFVRLYALYEQGGAYLDADIQILKDISPAIQASLTLGISNLLTDDYALDSVDPKTGIDATTGKLVSGMALQAGSMYSEPHHPFIKHCLESLYENGERPFLGENGEHRVMIIDDFVFRELNHYYGIEYKDETQRVGDELILYNSHVFAVPAKKNEETYLIHWFDQSWFFHVSLKKRLERKFYWFFRSNLYLRLRSLFLWCKRVIVQ